MCVNWVWPYAESGSRKSNLVAILIADIFSFDLQFGLSDGAGVSIRGTQMKSLSS